MDSPHGRDDWNDDEPTAGALELPLGLKMSLERIRLGSMDEGMLTYVMSFCEGTDTQAFTRPVRLALLAAREALAPTVQITGELAGVSVIFAATERTFYI